ncbi:hypothetical protein C8F04DRAFT_1176908 [Mycena alexandri]|uniref:Uncharacterized protein n=1 Tax=Mycena alexandri TaxID=1745969 RepID=A0AAD6TA44_9AGAR|nr:hypothetical protein C8F04DRAFT_1176908 [Mycena alexandri]
MAAYAEDLRAYFGRKQSRREASKAYNDRNRAVRNLKKRDRMAALRASRVGEPSSLAEERQAAAREAARVYRENRQNNNTYSDLLLTDMHRADAGEPARTPMSSFTLSSTQDPARASALSSGPLPLYLIDSRTSSPILVGHTLPDVIANPTPSPVPSGPPSPVRSSPSPPPYDTATTQGVQRRLVYAVHVGREGEIFMSFREAWARCLSLEDHGDSPALVVANSVMHALAWIDNAPLAEEREIRYREIVQEALVAYRGEDPDSSSDESAASSPPDETRSMAELVAELDARQARAHWRRMS